MESTILHQIGRFTVRPEQFGNTKGYAVYQDATSYTHSVRVASIGYSGADGLRKAIIEADKRYAADARPDGISISGE